MYALEYERNINLYDDIIIMHIGSLSRSLQMLGDNTGKFHEIPYHAIAVVFCRASEPQIHKSAVKV